MDELNKLAEMGIPLPSPAWLAGAIVFGVIGIAAFRYGRRKARPRIEWVGIALILYPYVVSNTLLLYGVGGALCLALYLWRK